MRDSVELIYRDDLPGSFYENSPGLLSLAETHIWCNWIDRGDVVRAIRSEAGQTVADAAGLVGVSPSQIERWERGEVVPRQSSIERVAIALAVPLLPLVMSMSATEAWEEWGATVTVEATPDDQ